MSELKSGVYKLSWERGYFYFGQAQNLKKRWEEHKKRARYPSEKSHGFKLYDVWKKHGEPKFEVLAYLPVEFITQAEQNLITEHLGNGLLCNTRHLADSNRGIKRTKPAHNKGVPMSEELRYKMSISMIGRFAGVKHPMVKLTEAQVLEIRSKYIPFVCTAEMIGLEYGIDKANVLAIVNNKIWKTLPSADVSKNKELIKNQGVIAYDGKSMNIRQWAAHLGMDYLTLYQRIKIRKWSIEKSINADVVKDNGSKLTPQQADEIRAKYIPIKYGSVVLGKEYNVSHKTILSIVKNKSYNNAA